MKRFYRPLSSICHYLPSVIILVFGMMALYSTVHLLESRQNQNEIYHSYVAKNLAFQGQFYDFEHSYDKFLMDGNNKDFGDVKTRFKLFNATIQASLKNSRTYSPIGVSDYNRSFNVIVEKAHEIEGKFTDSNSKGELKNPSVVMLSLKDNVDVLHESMKGLQKISLNIYEQEAMSPQLDSDEAWLYWSVITMGLSGFLLVLLNIDKIRKLGVANEEKNSTLSVLKNRLEALELARDGVLIMDHDDRVRYLNKSLCSISAIDSDEKEMLVGGTWDDVFSSSDTEVIREDILPELNELGFWFGEFPMYRDDNSILYTEMSFTRLPDGGLIGTIQDITEKHRAECERKEMEGQFHQAQKLEAIGRLAGGVAHDFNNILAAMNGYAEFLIDDLDPKSEQYRFADNIYQAGIQARDLVDQMLTFSRRGDQETECFDLVESMADVASMLRATMPKTIEFGDNSALPYAPISGNTTQISQLIMNLCVNAQDAMVDEHGTLKIDIEGVCANDVELETEGIKLDALPDARNAPFLHIEDVSASKTRLILGHLAKNKNYAKLSIEDTGCGMSRVILEHVFEPFFTTKPVDKGTGLGLATVHGVVISHQAMMVIESQIGKGTCFDIYFPLSQDAVLENSDDPPISQAEKQNSLKDRNILVVEDQEAVRVMVVQVLERLGLNVKIASSGLEGLEVIRNNPEYFDVVITDYNMPKMTGLEMVQQACIDYPDLPFIILSGYSQEKISELIADHPSVKQILRKPVSKGLLSECIEDVLQKAEINIAAVG